jgi:hypothetical protein
MKLVRAGAVAGIVSTMLLLAGTPAMADPPTSNPNGNVLTFSCVRGAEAQNFQAIGILQSAQISGQRLDGTGVVIFKRIEVNGQVVYDVPGQAGRSDLWTCSIAEVPGVIVTVMLTPRG